MNRLLQVVAFFTAIGTILPVFASQKRTVDSLDRSTSSKRSRKLSPLEVARYQTRLNNQLVQAVQRKDEKAIRELQERGADINAMTTAISDLAGNSPCTLLHAGFAPNRIRLLVRHGANLEGSIYHRDIGQHGVTPLHAAVHHNISIKNLLELGAKVNARTEEGHTPLHFATNKNSGIDWLLVHGADMHEIDYNGNTLLHLLCKKERFGDENRRFRDEKELILYFLQLEKIWHPDTQALNQKNFDGETPLHIALRRKSVEFIDFLKKNGANDKLKTALGETCDELFLDAGLGFVDTLRIEKRRKCRATVQNYFMNQHGLPKDLADLELKFLGTFEPR